ncbi:MAG: hypothetical protein Q8Q02_09920 [Nocardioides sp.]|nr:hypothetical protein [Nocardioides sp.]
MSVLTHAAAVLVTMAALDVALTGRVGLFFDLVFISVCLAVAATVGRDAFPIVAVAPPVAMLVLCLALGTVAPGTVADATDGALQATVTGLANRAVALAAGYAVALGTILVRHSNRVASPAP